MQRSLIMLLLLVACNGDKNVEPEPEIGWQADIGPLFSEHCVGCHSDSEDPGYPFVFDNYDDAALFSSVAATETAAHRMPPWGPCTPMSAIASGSGWMI